jgi:hypothetical protein
LNLDDPLKGAAEARAGSRLAIFTIGLFVSSVDAQGGPSSQELEMAAHSRQYRAVSSIRCLVAFRVLRIEEMAHLFFRPGFKIKQQSLKLQRACFLMPMLADHRG